MAKWRCNACGETYSDTGADGTQYFHVCFPYTLEHAEFDDAGKQSKEEKRTPRERVRNENARAGLIYVEGKAKVEVRNPEERNGTMIVDADSLIVSEGAGRTLVE